MRSFPVFKCHQFLVIILVTLFSLQSSLAQLKKDFIVVLDAGHGGKDPGKIGYKNAKEKDVALNIVLKTGKVLEKIPGLKVIYTRKKDVFVDLWKRGDIANDADADLFVSVHCNAHTSQAIGAETWVLGLHANERNFRVAKAENEVILQESNHQERYQGFDPSSPTSVIGLSLEQEEYLDQSLLLASIIQQEFEEKLKRVNRGVKQAGFVVLYQTYMPSVLIETGFLTNRIEGKYLYSKAGQLQMSKAIASSIKDYYDIQKLNVADVDFELEMEEQPKSTPETVLISDSKPKEIRDTKQYYKVQIASSKNKIATLPQNFKGLRNVESVKVGEYYKYYYGIYNSKTEAELALNIAKSKTYTSAFIATFKNKLLPVIQTIKSKKELTELYYKVQLASSKNLVETVPENFKGLQPIESVKVGDYYKYYFAKTSNYNKARAYLNQARKKTYNSAFIVAFKGGKRITVKEALIIQKM